MSVKYFWTKGHHLHVGDTILMPDPTHIKNEDAVLVEVTLIGMDQVATNALNLTFKEFKEESPFRYPTNDIFRVRVPENGPDFHLRLRATDLRPGDLLQEPGGKEWKSVVGLQLELSNLEVHVRVHEGGALYYLPYNETVVVYRR